jgi:hypothetical protein
LDDIKWRGIFLFAQLFRIIEVITIKFDEETVACRILVGNYLENWRILEPVACAHLSCAC